MNSARVMCAKHPEELISNICCLRRCLAPLCPDCIDSHIKEHTSKGEIVTVDTLGRLKRKSSQFLGAISRSLEDDYNLLNSSMGVDFDQLIAKALQELNSFKTKMMEQIGSFFRRLEEEFTTHLRASSKDNHNPRELKTKLSSIIEELKTIQNNIESPALFDSVNMTVRMDAKALLDKFHQETDEVISRSLILPIQLSFEDYSRELENLLSKMVKVENREVSAVSNIAYLNQMRQRRDETELQTLNEYFLTKFIQ